MGTGEKTNAPKITTGTIIRFIVLLVFLINMTLTMFGNPPLNVGEADIEIAVNAVYAAISAIGLIIAALVGYWKDNDITERARNWKKYLKK